MAASSAEKNKELVRRYYEISQEEDFDALEEVLARDYRLHGVPGSEGGELTGRDAVEGYLRELLEAFPDMTPTIEELVAEGDTVAYRASITATHEGEFMGIPATGEEVRVDGEGFFRIEDGKLAEAWPLMDRFGMLQQLGVVDLSIGAQRPEKPMTTDETGLQQRLDEVESVLTSGDADQIGDLYTQNGQLLPPGVDFVTGREAVAEFWIGVGETGVETIEIEPEEVETHESTAWRVGTATLADADGATIDRVKFIEIWSREDGEWRIHRDIWNSNTADEQ